MTWPQRLFIVVVVLAVIGCVAMAILALREDAGIRSACAVHAEVVGGTVYLSGDRYGCVVRMPDGTARLPMVR